jgi:transposase
MAKRFIAQNITLNEFAKLAGIGSSTAYNWHAKGRLDSIDVGGKMLDRKLALEWIALNVTPKATA